METLERIWEFVGIFFSSILKGFERGVTALFGSSNARYIRRLEPRVAAINELEPKYEKLTDAELKEQSAVFRKRLAVGETLDDLLSEAFAVCREASKRFLHMRHYDVQLMGGMVLHSGAIAEMVTGEGKTLVATLPAYLNALTGKGVHVVTVNDYLARRDMEWMSPIYKGLGISVAAIQSDMETLERQKAYACDITYGTNNEFGFDYLRDNMRPAARGDDRFPKRMQQSQGKLHYAIIDEVDNILIDEARTPLIISGPAHDDIAKYAKADRVSRQLKRDAHFEVNEKDRSSHLTDEGVREAEKIAAKMGFIAPGSSFYSAGNMEWPHLIDNSLKAHYLYKLDVNYVIKDGKIVIVDEFTGRLMEGRQWSDGLHQAVEAKEGVQIKEETQTLATITLQNFFKLYDKICGMTGTAMTEAGEFWKIYELDVVAIPTNRPLQRKTHPDVIYCTEHEKYDACADEIERLNRWDVLVKPNGDEIWGTILKDPGDNGEFTFQPRDSKKKQTPKADDFKKIEKKGRPILVGTVSIEKSERLSSLLDRRGVKHEVLNAKHHKREAEIVAQAGRRYAVTIATNMAGRGTDIILGGNPETMAWARLQDKYPTRLEVPEDEWSALVKEIEKAEGMKAEGMLVKQLGGLHVIATERHESRRIDLQLRGRCGRQGDPGSSRFFLSLEDDLMRIFAGEWVKTWLQRLGMQEGEAIESRMVTRRIEGAQKKVEERNFEIRKNLLEYDEVMDEQRKRVYGYRQQILDGVNCKKLILDMIEKQVAENLGVFLGRDYRLAMYAGWAGSQLGCSLEPRDFRGMDAAAAESHAKFEAERLAETAILDAAEENLPIEEEPDEWNWEAMAKFANARFGTNFRDRDLKKFGRDALDQELLNKAKEAMDKVDLSDGARYLEEDFGVRTALGWLKAKFEIDIPLENVQEIEAKEFIEIATRKAADVYEDKEAEYPVIAALYRFTSGMQGKLDRESLVAWASERFDTELSLDDFKSKQREEIREILVAASREHRKRADVALAETKKQVDAFFGDEEEHRGKTASVIAAGNDSLKRLCGWMNERYQTSYTEEELAPLEKPEMEIKLLAATEDCFRPEIRTMERGLVLQIVDGAWKDHLLAMDYLRSAVGMRGYAQVDPKVEYKREGMRQFERMWNSIGERVTDLVFKMELLDEGFVGSTFKETAATHAQAATPSEIAQQQQAAIDASRGGGKIEPIRRRDRRIGRNDPCPCGSGKKYKQCCMRSERGAA